MIVLIPIPLVHQVTKLDEDAEKAAIAKLIADTESAKAAEDDVVVSKPAGMI